MDKKGYINWIKRLNFMLPFWAEKVFALREKNPDKEFQGEIEMRFAGIIEIANGFSIKMDNKDFRFISALDQCHVNIFIDSITLAEELIDGRKR